MEEKNKRFFSLNIGAVIFGAIFLYLIITLIIYLSAKHVSSYMVTSGTLANNDSYLALAIRQEEVVNASASGYVSYYIQDSTKASKNDVVCSIGDTKNSLNTENLAESDINAVRDLASAFSTTYKETDFDKVYNLKYAMNASIVKDSDGKNVSGTLLKAVSDGLVVYTMDGMEGIVPNDVTPDSFQSKSYTSTQLRKEGSITQNEPIYRLVESDTWHLVFQISDRQYANLSSRSTIRVRFDKDNQTETGDLNLFDKDNLHYADITLYSGVVRYCNERYLDIELVTNTQSGLKIPISSIVNKSFYTIPSEFLTSGGEDSNYGFSMQVKGDGNETSLKFVETELYEQAVNDDGIDVYYVDKSEFKPGDVIVKSDSNKTFTIGETASLEGVYCTNRGYAQFRKINILDQNEEFCIVEEGTAYGIAQYDYIVRDGSEVDESQILGGNS